MAMIRLLILIIILFACYKVIRWLFPSPGKMSKPLPSQQPPAKTEDLVEDPCCHTYLPVSQAYQAMIGGKTIYFCSEKCYQNYMHQKGMET